MKSWETIFSLCEMNSLKFIVHILPNSVCWHQVAELYSMFLAHEWGDVPVNLSRTESEKEEIWRMWKFEAREFNS